MTTTHGDKEKFYIGKHLFPLQRCLWFYHKKIIIIIKEKRKRKKKKNKKKKQLVVEIIEVKVPS